MDAKALLGDLAVLRAQRSALEGTWREIARLVLPRHDTFGTGGGSNGKRSSPDPTVYDDTGAGANEMHAAMLAYLLTPDTQQWHGLVPADEGVAKRIAPRRWCEAAAKRLFRHRARTNFAAQMHEAYLSIGAFGSGCIYVEEQPGRGPSYEAVPASELYFSTGTYGEKDRVFRSYRLRGRIALDRFRDRLPEARRKAAEKQPEQEIDFVHAVYANPEHDPQRVAGAKGFRFTSCHLDTASGVIVGEGGYRTMPYCIGRYVVAPGEPYGRSPAFGVLPTLRMLNKMAENQLVEQNRRAQPPLLATDDDNAAPPLMLPNAVNYGWLAEDGTPRIRPMDFQSDPAAFGEAMATARERVERAFLVRLFLLLRQGPQMTATEVLQLAQEKGIVLAPVMGRLQAELLQPIVVREVDILNHMGELPPDPPREIVESGGLRVDYTSPLAKVLHAGEAQAVMEATQALGVLAQLDATATDIIHAGRAAEHVSRVMGVPAALLRTEDERAERDQARAAAEQSQQLLAAAPVAADVAKSLGGMPA